MCFIKNIDKDFWGHKDFWKNQNEFYSNKDGMGYSFLSEYLIKNDTLILQYFVRNTQTYYSNYVIEEKYKILNDTELLKLEYTSYKGYLRDETKKTFQINDTLRYFPVNNFDFKPTAWYLNKVWYNSGLHETRKISNK
jgi:hypothetical protein